MRSATGAAFLGLVLLLAAALAAAADLPAGTCISFSIAGDAATEAYLGSVRKR
jgi:hypothetical protein